MNPDSRQTVHASINYLIVPPPHVDAQTNLKFQQSLTERGIEYDSVSLQGRRLTIRWADAFPLSIRVDGPGQEAVGTLGIVAPGPAVGVDLFLREAEAVGEAYRLTWGRGGQILAIDVTLRDLFDSSGAVAFEEIWQRLLGRPNDELAPFGRPVVGGGLRFVMPPHLTSPDPAETQVRIESFLRQQNKLWVETVFKWLRPRALDTGLNPRYLISTANDFVEASVLAFLMKSATSPGPPS